MKKLHMGTMAFGSDAMDDVAERLASAFPSHTRQPSTTSPTKQAFGTGGIGRRRDMSARVRDVVLALALCHNVRTIHYPYMRVVLMGFGCVGVGYAGCE